MKKNKKLLVVIISLTVLIILLWSVFSNSTNHTEQEHSMQTESNQATQWTCSMHPQIIRDQKGDCPICGMELIPKKNRSASHKHSHAKETSDDNSSMSEQKIQWTCSMHPQIIRDQKGDCPICGMELIPKKNRSVSHKHSHAKETSDDNSSMSEQKIQWTCSMHPQIIRDQKGNCPICGMELIPKKNRSASHKHSHAEETSDDNIILSNHENQLANIQTIVVHKNKAIRSVVVSGKVYPDERKTSTQTSHINGRIEKLFVNFTGEYVQKGNPLVLIYSPELVTAQEELFQAYKLKDKYPNLYLSARSKLKNWKLTDKQVDDILKETIPQESITLLADISGYILDKKIQLGDHVKEGQALYTISDLSKIWVLLDIYEQDLVWVKKGDKVHFQVSALPGKLFSSTITFIDPVIDPSTRVAKARLEINNAQLYLKPEMFVSGTIKSKINKQANVITIPQSAVLWTGKQSLVYIRVSTKNSHEFAMRSVILGPSLGDQYIIQKGLEEGDVVVTQGAFMIDAARQLSGKKSMMNTE